MILKLSIQELPKQDYYIEIDMASEHCGCEGYGNVAWNISHPPPCELDCTERCACGKLICQHVHMKMPSQDYLDMADEEYCPEHWAEMKASICKLTKLVPCEEEESHECHYNGSCQKMAFIKGEWHRCNNHYCTTHLPDPFECEKCGVYVSLCPSHLWSQRCCSNCHQK